MLFLREVKKTVVSISYVLFVCAVVLSLFSQGALDFSDSCISEPQIGGNYGTKQEEIPEIIMPAALEALFGEFCENNYQTYPSGIIKNVKLDESKKMEIAEIIAYITGEEKEAIFNAQTASSNNSQDGFTMEFGSDIQVQGDTNSFVINSQNDSSLSTSDIQESNLTVRSDISYAEFKNQMQKVDDILGGGSNYAADSLIGFGTVPISYEEAVERYQLANDYDKITGGYARLFSDYATVMSMSILPVFLAVIMSMRDKRAKMADLIYTRKVSGGKVILTRYFALVISVMIPVIILSYISNASVWGRYHGMELDYLAPLKYDFGWIMPSAMIAIALGMCFTELTNSPIAVIVQGLWWILDVNLGYKTVAASYSLFRLAPRHNAGEMSYFRTKDFLNNFNHLLANRLLFVGLSMVLVAVTIIIYEMKRKGRLDGNHKWKRAISYIRNRKNQFKA